MHDPPVLLLDEPYQGFDWQTYLAFWELAGELRDRGTATVVISHLVFEHERFDRVCHLSGGRVGEEAGSHAPAA
jgi:ABC-type multidrug transport system ATPase subunit